MANYPASLDSYTNPQGTSLLSNGPDHAADHTAIHGAIIAIENTAGTTAGTNVLKNFAAGDFPARINGSNVLQQVISGTVNTTIGTLTGAVMGTPAITGGTWSNAKLIGTAQITGGTITNAALIGTSQFTGGSVSNAVVGTPAITGGTATNILLTTPSFSSGAIGPNDIGTATNLLGFTKVTSSQTSTTTPTDVDVTSLAATVTVPTIARAIRITVVAQSFIVWTASAKTGYIKIKEGTTVLQQSDYTYGTFNTSYELPVYVSYVGTFSAGAHTFKVAMSQDTAGTMQFTQNLTAPGIITVEAL